MHAPNMHAPDALRSKVLPGRGLALTEAASEGGADAAGWDETVLESDHHEICTALTVLRTNVELVRIELRQSDARHVDPREDALVDACLAELDVALDRIHRVARSLRSRRSDEPKTTRDGPKQRILP